MTDQGYISSTLFHFTGRNAGSNDQQFEVLKKIIEERKFQYDPLNKFPNAIPTFTQATIDSYGEISAVPAVCFCDIPVEELTIHTQKYSMFGLGFLKETLMKHGVRPIWYIPKNSNSAIVTTEKLATRFPTELQQLFGITTTIIKKLHEGIPDDHIEYNQLSDDPEVQLKLQNLNSSHFFILAEIAWYFKFYDSSLPDDDPDNYYFEREWRKVNGNIDFNLNDVETVIVPNDDYRGALVNEFAELEGRIQLLA